MNTKKSWGKHSLMALLLVSSAIVGGCNTVAGVGKDVEVVGEKTTEAAQKASSKL
jgi:predicted small secreted protein